MNIIIDRTRKIIKEELVLPLVLNLESTIEDLDLGDEGSIFQMEEELTDILYKLIENKISEIVNFMISKNKIHVEEEIKQVFKIEDIKANITEFFDSFKINDLYLEIYEMLRNKGILDNQEFYLYFYDIRFGGVKYPIFYIPLNIELDKDVLIVKPDSQVYINKKALEFIAQEYNLEKERKGSLKKITDRIIYLANNRDGFKDYVSDILHELINFFELKNETDINDSDIKYSRSLLVNLSNNSYICLAEKSDESIVNDYENILQMLSLNDNEITDEFCKLINDFIFEEPSSFGIEVEDNWESLNTEDKLVTNSPIPLNREQRQILIALNHKDCKYITVEGPPGTGKSHTITAIVFDAILKNQSILFLSDKKEALDVVEDKISNVMNKVRVDKKFQNPILRLGKTGNTYAQILSTNSLAEIKTYYRVVKNDYEQLESKINKSIDTLKESLEVEKLALMDINVEEIIELYQLRDYLHVKNYPLDLNEWISQRDSSIIQEEIREILKKLNQDLKDEENNDLNKLFKLCGITMDDFETKKDFEEFVHSVNDVLKIAKDVEEEFREKTIFLKDFSELNKKHIDRIVFYINEFRELKSKVFGFLFKKEKVRITRTNFIEEFLNVKIENPEKCIYKLESVLEILKKSKDFIDKKELFKKEEIDYLNLLFHFLKDKDVSDLVVELNSLLKSITLIYKELEKYPETLKKSKLNTDTLATIYKNPLIEIPDPEFEKLIRYIFLEQKVKDTFNDIPHINYIKEKDKIESLLTTKMTYLLDSRVVEFSDNNKNTARKLRDIIRTKQQFPKEEFDKLKNAFPCILVGIRDFAEYIPLEPGIFDLIVIDEASQVSIAQAFPALLRAKKVVIFGDKKQFSNTKAALARSDTNKEYLNNLEITFKEEVSTGVAQITSLKKFNIKTSILDFFESINNFNVQLLKHFRAYKEIISYSNKYFYRDNLQVMKIRGKHINDVLKFTFIKHDGKEEIISNTNIPEIEFIVSELINMKENKIEKSVGIITPHTHQQKLLMEKINNLPESSYLFDKLKLKIMTFDTCQGEERDIIFYSMVATKEMDRLWGVFIKDLKSVDLEEQGQIKAQRLNVGFSRAKECMHLVLSKPTEEYSGSIGEALRHYFSILEEAKKEKDISQVDSKSKMEPKVMNWFYQTNFWKENKQYIHFEPQFKIGEYFKQLDKRYNHPKYIVDFLIIYSNGNSEYRIVIEYDGLSDHFKEGFDLNEYNYQDYYTDEHLYREKVIESYGYNFIRINRFNIGNNPIDTLDKQINQILKGDNEGTYFQSNIQNTVENMIDGKMKMCLKCKKIKSISDFKDSNLLNGFGRICNTCKVKRRGSPHKSNQKELFTDVDELLCPKCNSEMVLREGKYGYFYGCSKFPYCDGTRSSKE
ncbi:MAG: topoisomerase DNA-binding C4 zinc finger domain-containing protein [Actinobacteria bacterium]|nr:topoisomerase DNA-binding C4 zinc finger domain-containing protein [Actinomycetota bacterium]